MHRAAPDEQTSVLDGLAGKPFEQWKSPWQGVTSVVKQFPHCDMRILHAPGECEYCDGHQEWQALRLAWGTCFTGYAPDAGELPDPFTNARGKSNWMGNQPRLATAARPAAEEQRGVIESVGSGPKKDRLYRFLASLTDWFNCTACKAFGHNFFTTTRGIRCRRCVYVG